MSPGEGFDGRAALDVPKLAGPSNRVAAARILSLDPVEWSLDELSQTVRFQQGGSDPDKVNLTPMGGAITKDISARVWYETKGGGDPEGLQQTGVFDWTNYNDRMWYIYRIFEQTHTYAAMRDTVDLLDERDVDFLSASVRQQMGRQ